MSAYGRCVACSRWVPKGDRECPHCGSPQTLTARLSALLRTLVPERPQRGSGRLCTACNRLLGEGDTACPHCGVEQTIVRRAARAAGGLVPAGITATHLVLASFALLFTAPMFALAGAPDFSLSQYLLRGSALIRGEVDLLIAMGANHGVLLAAGELWRLVTAAFLHVGLIHILFNAYALTILGPLIEGVYGRGWFFFMYVLAAVAGNLLSWSAKGLAFANAGASGGIFGLIGIGIVECWRHRWANRELLRTLITWAAFGLVFGMMARADNWAHVGGLLGGAGAACLLPASRVTRRGRWRTLGSALGAATVMLVVACFGLQVMWAREVLAPQ